MEEWFQANKLTVNLSKTKFILFGSRQRLTNSTTTRLEQDLNLKFGRQIDRVTHTKFLGLVLDENLSWSFHIDSISRKIAKSIGILYRARHYLNLDSLKNLYYSFIYSHIFHMVLSSGAATINRNSFLSISYKKEHHAQLHLQTTGLQVDPYFKGSIY